MKYTMCPHLSARSFNPIIAQAVTLTKSHALIATESGSARTSPVRSPMTRLNMVAKTMSEVKDLHISITTKSFSLPREAAGRKNIDIQRRTIPIYSSDVNLSCPVPEKVVSISMLTLIPIISNDFKIFSNLFMLLRSFLSSNLSLSMLCPPMTHKRYVMHMSWRNFYHVTFTYPPFIY